MGYDSGYYKLISSIDIYNMAVYRTTYMIWDNVHAMLHCYYQRVFYSSYIISKFL